MPWYFINVTLHVFAALLWLGGMFFFALVGAPVLRRVEDFQVGPGSSSRSAWAACCVVGRRGWPG